MHWISPVIVVALLASCGVSEGDRSDTATAATLGCNDTRAFVGVAELTELHGLAESEVIASLGEPDNREDITLHAGETLPEFFIEVHNTYQPDDPSTEGRVIRYFRWDREGYSEAVFLHQPASDGSWMVLESVKWSDDVEF
ncbi:MAG: hypothetical protein R6V62_08120 [Candidatus Fermentibacteraceae bacterium]